jgi:hypothetical protein
MAQRMRITVTDDKGAVVARFDNTDDAMVFAAASTANVFDDRELTVTDIPGYINLRYKNGNTYGLQIGNQK